MASLTERLRKSSEAKNKVEAKSQVVDNQANTQDFVITEADIKRNQVYQVATDTSKSLKQRVDEVVALRAYNPALTEEENAKNLQAVKETLVYFENSIMHAAMEANKFTHDDALSLFDDTVRTLQGRLRTYQNYINPFVKALDVLGKAREAGIPTSELLQEVQDLKDKGIALKVEKDQQLENLGKIKAEIEPLQQQTNQLFAELKHIEGAIGSEQKARSDAQQVIAKEDEGTFSFITKDRTKIKQANSIIDRADFTLERLKSNEQAIAEQSKVTADTLARLNSDKSDIESNISELEAQILATDNELTADEDVAAISRLLEITGKAFKEERNKITELIIAISEDSVKDLEQTAARFKSGDEELGIVSAKVTNITDFNRVIFEASEAAKTKDDNYANSLKETISRIEAEKGEDAKFDPDYEEAKNQLRSLNKHDKASLSFSEQSGHIQGLASGQLINFEATATAFQQKHDDCRRLRTETTVKTSTQSMTTLKALELATASEKLGVTDEILSEIGETSSAALRGIFENVTNTLDVQNDRQAKAIKDALTASLEINAFSDEIREKIKEGDVARRALNEAHSELEGQSDKLSGISSEATREVAEDANLEEKITQAAEAAFNAKD